MDACQTPAQQQSGHHRVRKVRRMEGIEKMRKRRKIEESGRYELNACRGKGHTQ